MKSKKSLGHTTSTSTRDVICTTREQNLKHCWVDKYNHGLRVFVPANPWHYQLNYFNITDILKLLQYCDEAKINQLKKTSCV